MSDQLESATLPADSEAPQEHQAPQASKKLGPEALQRILMAVASAEGIDPDEMNLALSQLTLDKETLKAEVEQEIRREIENDYELEADVGFEINFDGLESARTIKMGVGEFETDFYIRWLVSRDGERLAQTIPDVIRYVYKAGPKALIGLSPLQLLNDVLVMFAKPKVRADFKDAIYKELSFWLVVADDRIKAVRDEGYSLSDSIKAINRKNDIQEAIQFLKDSKTEKPKKAENRVLCTPEFLRDKCQPGQIIRKAIATYQVNELFFSDLWVVLPGQLTGPINMLVGKIMTSIKNAGQLNWDYQKLLNGIGTIPNGGIPNGLIPSLQSISGLPQLLGKWISLNSGDTKNPSTDESTGLDTSHGSTPKMQKLKPARRIIKTAIDHQACPDPNGKPFSNGPMKTVPTMPNFSESTPATFPEDDFVSEPEMIGYIQAPLYPHDNIPVYEITSDE